MKKLILILFTLILLSIAAGYYIRYIENDQKTADIVIGIAVLSGSFILMPLFLYHRWKGKRLKDYTLTKENLKKMREKGLD